MAKKQVKNTRWKNVKDDPFERLPPRTVQAARERMNTSVVETYAPDCTFTQLPMGVAKGVRRRVMKCGVSAYATGGFIKPVSMF